MLKAVMVEAAEACFNDLGKSTMTERRRELEGLGVRISQALQWAGEEIMVVAYAALEDANYHTEAGPLYQASKHVAAMPAPQATADV